MQNISQLFCFVLLLSIVNISQSFQDLPTFHSLPIPEIYEEETVREVTVETTICHANANVTLAVLYIGSGRNGDEMKILQSSGYTSSLSSNDVQLLIESRKPLSNPKGCEHIVMKILRVGAIVEKPIHVLAQNPFGTVVSRPFKIIRKVLNPFPLVHHETIGFMMGNVGQILCVLPHSRPSPPNIEFLHDNIPINATKGTKYKKVYVQTRATILLIKNLQPQDAGSYTCTASLAGTSGFQKSDKKTTLLVQTPKENIKPRIRISSHDNDRSSGSRIIEVLEGSNITLYCLYESAPVAEVTWYWSDSNKKYEVDPQFGTLSITNVKKEDESELSCLANDVVGRSFSLRVLPLPVFESSPEEILYSDYKSRLVEITCNIQHAPANSRIKWFFNGKILTENSNKKTSVRNNKLVITSLEKEHIGIYQCWLENDLNLWSRGITVIKEKSDESNSQRENVSLKNIKTESHVTIHLSCSLPTSLLETKENFTVKWFRKKKESLEAVDITKTYKYMEFMKRETNEAILSVLVPSKADDEGLYVCRVFDKSSRVIQSVNYYLTVDDSKPTESDQYPLKVPKSKAKKNLVEITNVTQINDYILGVEIHWHVVPEDGNSNKIDHFRVEFQRSAIKSLAFSSETADWANVIMAEEFFTTKEVTIVDTQNFHPNYAVRFRVIAILKAPYQLPAVDNNNQTVMDTMRSSWSKPVEFRNLLSCNLTLQNAKAVDPTAVEVTWTHNCVRETQWHKILFYVIYASVDGCVTSKRCHSQSGAVMKNYQTLLVFPEFKDLVLSMKIEQDFGEFFQLNITGLDPQTQYVVAVYGQVSTLREAQFIPLSNVLNVSTLKIPEVETKDTSKQDNGIKINRDDDDTRNRVLFLVLGSLAGVLFVVAAVMFGMCAWYYMKKHMKIHKAQLKPNDSHHPTLLYHYPPSSMSSPLCFSSRIDPISPYPPSVSNNSNSKLLYFPSQKIGNSPINSCHTNQKDLWPVNFFNHSPSPMLFPEKVSSDKDSDIDSLYHNEKPVSSHSRRPIMMGIEQASSTYSRVGSERRLSVTDMNSSPYDHQNGFKNLTLPRKAVLPIAFPQPPKDPDFQIYENSKSDQQNENIYDQSSNIPFLFRSSDWRNDSLRCQKKRDYFDNSNKKILSQNAWISEAYYDPYSSNSSLTNDNPQMKSIVHT